MDPRNGYCVFFWFEMSLRVELTTDFTFLADNSVSGSARESAPAINASCSHARGGLDFVRRSVFSARSTYASGRRGGR
jgi:hypothetical protein